MRHKKVKQEKEKTALKEEINIETITDGRIRGNAEKSK
jgi:hypothetical protein